MPPRPAISKLPEGLPEDELRGSLMGQAAHGDSWNSSLQKSVPKP